jgi:hypothetical protein
VEMQPCTTSSYSESWQCSSFVGLVIASVILFIILEVDIGIHSNA